MTTVRKTLSDPSSPDLPIRRDSPKKALVIVLAVLLGGMLGAGIVLGRNLLANYQRRTLP